MVMAYEMPSNFYFAKVLDPRTYYEIGMDIIKRHVYPLVLDSKLLCPKENYVFASINKYFDSGV
jgi:hypothetical protein